MIDTRKTFDQLIYEYTAEEIILGLTENMQETHQSAKLYALTRGMDFNVVKGMMIEPINKMMKKYHINKKGNVMELPDRFRELFDVIKLGEYDMTFDQVIELSKSIYKEHGNKFYGVLITRKSGIPGKETFNPFHPLNAKYIAEDDLIPDKTVPEFTMMVYMFKKEPAEIMKLGEYEHLYNKGDEKDFIHEIINILAATDTDDQYEVMNRNFEADIVDSKFVLKYEQIITNKETGETMEQEHSNHLYIPTQIVNNNGLAYPWYGTVYSTKGVTWDISPMQSANISYEGYSELGGGSRVCTKLGDSKTLKGISALNHSNLTSPLKKTIAYKGALLYGQVALKIGLGILANEDLINVNEPKKPLKYTEWIKENEGASMQEYIEYTREILKHAKVEIVGKPYEEIPPVSEEEEEEGETNEQEETQEEEQADVEL